MAERVAADVADVTFDCDDDLLENIFSRLPVKTLLRLKCLKRSWRNVIESPRFIDLHFKTANEAKNLLMWAETDEMGDYGRFVSLATIDENVLPVNSEDLENFEPGIILSVDDLVIPQILAEDMFDSYFGPCYGIVCVPTGDENPHDRFSLWNPATRKYRNLPLTPRPSMECDMWWTQFIGFGFVVEVKDLVLLHILVAQKDGQNINQCDIYNLSTNTWRTVLDNVLTQCTLSLNLDSCATDYRSSRFYCLSEI